MNALVVYESFFGNTRQVAEAVADGLSEHVEVCLRSVSEVPASHEEPLDLVVVGGPTHAFSLSRPSTRASAQQQGAQEGEPDYGLREWIADLQVGPHAALVAAFDTRVEKVRRLPGSAAKKAAALMRHLGYTPAGRESFYVVDTRGPLVTGEVERARVWGSGLGEDVVARAATRR